MGTSVISSKNLKFLTIFFVLNFLLSSPLYILAILDPEEMGVLVNFVFVFVPMISALILTFRSSGSTGAKELLKKSFDFRKITKKVWYAPILFLIPIIYLAVFVILVLNGETLGESIFSLEFLPILPFMFFVFALGEEIGWMGYAYDPMEEKWNALGASLILGIIWAVWHIPIIMYNRSLLWLVGQILTLVVWRSLFAWIYNNTGKSVFAAILFHAAGNVAVTGLPILTNDLGPVLSSVLMFICLVIITRIWDPKTFAQQKKESVVT